jgi:dienelactone hydrolase
MVWVLGWVQVTATFGGMPWDRAALEAAPQWTYLERPKAEGVRAITYEGLPYRGESTRVFAWLGLPEVEAGTQVPAMVLVHGGGGTAFEEWVRLWVSRGYAAIAMDTCGQLPVGHYGRWFRDERGGPPGWGGFDQIQQPVQDQWTYHAVADVLLAHSLIRSLPEVDAGRVGVTGISWGGYLTCLVAGVDARFALAVPVYGCGFYRDTVFANNLNGMEAELAARWMSLWDPSVYLGQAAMPILWVNGSNDFAYPMNAMQQSYRLATGPRSLCLRLRMPHAHGGAGENPEEIRVFADSHLKGGRSLARFTGSGREGAEVWATYEAPATVVRAELNITRDTGRWQDRVWEALPAVVEDGRIRATLPAEARVYYFNLFDDRGCVVSTEHEEVPVVGVHLVPQEPARILTVAPEVQLLDFERVAFGNLRLVPPSNATETVTLHFGEALEDGRVLRNPPGSVRYARVTVALEGDQPVVAAPPPDRRNTEVNSPRHPPAVLTPSEWGVVLPFRWVEVEGWPGEIQSQHIVRQAAFARNWDDDAAVFACSDDLLNRLWELCRYSIKATTFAGIYVDGDRERIAYEADAHLNQLSHYATEGNPQMARDTFDWLMKHPTWPTEWASYMILMAHADWMHTADRDWLAARYESLKDKLLAHRTRPDGLIDSSEERWRRLDLVDWPPGERDGFVFTPVNTVVNTFHLHALKLMAELAAALGRHEDAAAYLSRRQTTRTAFQELLWDSDLGRYRDGVGTDHTSLHANLFPLALGLVPEEARAGVVDWLVGRGMACSVYAAQYLMEGLFQNEAGTQALGLMTADGDRSWRHMVESGTTITWEAWDQKYKPNQDWNHPWGAAPANLLPRYLLGVQPLSPGWARARIRPHPGGLDFARGTVPTPRGPIEVRWEKEPVFRLSFSLPRDVRARVELPADSASTGVVWVEGSEAKPLSVRRVGVRWVVDEEVTGDGVLEVR